MIRGLTLHRYAEVDGRHNAVATLVLNTLYPATTLIRAAARERGFARMTISTS